MEHALAKPALKWREHALQKESPQKVLWIPVLFCAPTVSLWFLLSLPVCLQFQQILLALPATGLTCKFCCILASTKYWYWDSIFCQWLVAIIAVQWQQNLQGKCHKNYWLTAANSGFECTDIGCKICGDTVGRKNNAGNYQYFLRKIFSVVTGMIPAIKGCNIYSKNDIKSAFES